MEDVKTLTQEIKIKMSEIIQHNIVHQTYLNLAPTSLILSLESGSSP